MEKQKPSMEPMLGKRQQEEVRLKSRGVEGLSPNLSGRREDKPRWEGGNLPRYVSSVGPEWRIGLVQEGSGRLGLGSRGIGRPG